MKRNHSFNKIKEFVSKDYFILSIYLLLGISLSIRAFLLGSNQMGTHTFTFYNNYIIFKNSFLHLINNQNMYVLYLSEQWDLYKYSPPFAVFMVLFAYLPNWLGLLVWNLLNHLVLFVGLKNLNLKSKYAFSLSAVFVLQELFNATANAQSNALIVGLLLLAYSEWHKNNVFLATLYISLATFIKPFAIVFYLIWFFYPHKIKGILYSIVVFISIAASPILVVGWSGLIRNYSEWFVLLQEDHGISFGVSAMGVVQVFFGTESHKDIMILSSVLFLLLPLIRYKQYQNYLFQLFYISFLLIWMVIFNHRAESPTFIIAVVGVAVWYYCSPKNKIELVLLWMVLLLTQFSTSDLYPFWLRDEILKPYQIKAIPCILVWFWIGTKLIFKDFNKVIVDES